MRVIVIERYYSRGFPLEETSEHCFLSIKVLFWCCGSIYFVVPLLFSAVFLFSIFESIVFHCNISAYAIIIVLKIIKKYLGKCFSSPRRLGGGKMFNVDPSHLIHVI